MKTLRQWACASLVAFAAFNPSYGRAQPSHQYANCAWPLELSPEGLGNGLAPDDYARYWSMPFDSAYQTMRIEGLYPNARYFSFVAYLGDENGAPQRPADTHLYDRIIVPDKGSVNPFVRPISDGRKGGNSYAVYVSREGQNAPNTINVTKNFAWVVLRVYVPSADKTLSGHALSGGVPLPTIKLYDKNGAEKKLDPCPAPLPQTNGYYNGLRTINKLDDVRAFYQLMFPPGTDLLEPVDYDQPVEGRIWFAPPWNPPVFLLPNPDNKYIISQPGPYQKGRLLVMRGKAPTFPDTYEGTPKPSRGARNPDLRYWSLCNYDFAMPVPTVRCIGDQTAVIEAGYYTIVVTDDLLRPSWLDSRVNWLSWGDEQYPKLMFLRNMFPVRSEAQYADIPFQYAIQKVVVDCYLGSQAACKYPNATIDITLPKLPPRSDVNRAGPLVQRIMGDYYPVAAWCDKSVFERDGWRGCLQRQ